MFLSSSCVAALLGAVLALTSIEKAHAHGSNHTVDEQQLEDPTIPSRSLFADRGGAQASSGSFRRWCGTPDPTQIEVQSVARMVGSFYEGRRQGGDSQGKITIPVNFVVFKSTAGLGATAEQTIAQMNALNLVFKPDFEFVLTKATVVTNDRFFSQVEYNDPLEVVEREMKTLYKIGGMETLNIYCVFLDPGVNGDGPDGWATFPSDNKGVMDGVVISYKTFPGSSADVDGDVSIERKKC
jgi:hypothetical protein